LTWAAMSVHKDNWVQLHFQDEDGDSYETDRILVDEKMPPNPGGAPLYSYFGT